MRMLARVDSLVGLQWAQPQWEREGEEKVQGRKVAYLVDVREVSQELDDLCTVE